MLEETNDFLGGNAAAVRFKDLGHEGLDLLGLSDVVFIQLIDVVVDDSFEFFKVEIARLVRVQHTGDEVRCLLPVALTVLGAWGALLIVLLFAFGAFAWGALLIVLLLAFGAFAWGALLIVLLTVLGAYAWGALFIVLLTLDGFALAFVFGQVDAHDAGSEESEAEKSLHRFFV